MRDAARQRLPPLLRRLQPRLPPLPPLPPLLRRLQSRLPRLLFRRLLRLLPELLPSLPPLVQSPLPLLLLLPPPNSIARLRRIRRVTSLPQIQPPLNRPLNLRNGKPPPRHPTPAPPFESVATPSSPAARSVRLLVYLPTTLGRPSVILTLPNAVRVCRRGSHLSSTPHSRQGSRLRSGTRIGRLLARCRF